MPLHDHFHEPLAGRHSFTAFHSTWATYIAEELNAVLPAGYFAEPKVHFGIEIDVATWEDAGGPPRAEVPPALRWEPPKPQLTVPFTTITDVVEIRIIRNEGGPVLAGAVELVSPANKDRPANRDAFVSKCAAYVQQGAGLSIVDIVTERAADLHCELLNRLSPGNSGTHAKLYAAAYRPLKRNGDTELEVWHQSLELKQVLPTMPLWLRGGLCLPLHLEATYDKAIRMLRVAMNGA